MLTFQPRPEGLALVAINDSDEPWRQRLTIERWAFDGGVVGSVTLGFEIAARGVLEHPVPTWVSQADDGRRELIRARADDSEALWFFERDKGLDYPDPSYDSALRRQNGRSHFTVTARTLLRDLVPLRRRARPRRRGERAAGDAAAGRIVHLRGALQRAA